MFETGRFRRKLRRLNVIILQLVLPAFVLSFVLFLWYAGAPSETRRHYSKALTHNFTTAELVSAHNISSGKILCYIPVSRDKFHVIKIIQETWGSKCDMLVFYGSALESPENLKAFPNLVLLNVTERYEMLWGKTKAASLHLLHNYGRDYQWFLKADADTFVIIENLKRFLTTIPKDSKEDPLWFGFKMKHRKLESGYMSGGGGYVMNTQALSKFVKLVEKHRDQDVVDYGTSKRVEGCKTMTDEGIEDLELGRCFHYLRIPDISTLDNGKLRFLPLSLEKLISGDIPVTHWLWKQSWSPFKLGRQCCSSTLITIHEIPPDKLRVLYFILYVIKTSD